APRTPRPLSAPVGQRLLRGAPGAVVTLTVLRAGESDPLELSIVRERLTPVPPKGKMLEGGTTGYLKVAEIRAHSADDVRSELEALRKAGARAPGRSLPGAGVGGVGTKTGGAHAAGGGRPPAPARSFGALPMATLIDHGTAGPGEIVAGAL